MDEVVIYLSFKREFTHVEDSRCGTKTLIELSCLSASAYHCSAYVLVITQYQPTLGSAGSLILHSFSLLYYYYNFFSFM